MRPRARVFSRGDDSVRRGRLSRAETSGAGGTRSVAGVRATGLGLARRRWLFASAVLLGSFACRTPRSVHEPLPYAETKVEARQLLVRVDDARTDARSSTGKLLSLPEDFAVKAESRLWEVASGSGDVLEVRVRVDEVDEQEIVDARGEMTRLEVGLTVEVRRQGSPTVLRRYEGYSRADIPRDEATEAELQMLVEPTALNAFDRVWAARGTAPGINSALRRPSGLR